MLRHSRSGPRHTRGAQQTPGIMWVWEILFGGFLGFECFPLNYTKSLKFDIVYEFLKKFRKIIMTEKFSVIWAFPEPLEIVG